MKSPYQISKELGVSPQAVYKRMTDEFNNQFNNHIQRTSKGKYKLDAVAELALRSLFNQVQQPEFNSCIEPVQQPKEEVQQPLLNQLNSENTFLRSRVETLEEELKTERNHNRAQSDRLADLADQLVELNRNNQILLGSEQNRTNHTLAVADGEGAHKKTGFFTRFFSKRSREQDGL